MRASEVRALGNLGGQIGAGVVGWAEEVHGAVAAQVLGGRGGFLAPVGVAHDAVVGRAFSTIRALTAAAGDVGGELLSPLAGRSPLADSAAGGQIVAILDAVLGDRLHQQGSPLALPMALRSNGKDVVTDRVGLEAAFPDPSARLAVFVHGIAETDLAWMGRDSANRPWSYAHALQPNGWTCAAVRYKTGRRIAASGASLALLIEQTVTAWGLPVTELALVGHSMGGLVIRAACESAIAADHRWPNLVRSCVYLGAPHHGANLEKGANVIGQILGHVAEAGPVATLLRARSAGIQDLRHGRFTADHDPDADDLRSPIGSDVALLPNARHHLVAAHLGTSERNPMAMLLGDLMVRPSSALGLGHQRAMALEPAERMTLPASNHFGLLKDPRVAEALVEWLS